MKIPNVKLIGNIHGNEVVGREVLLHFLYVCRYSSEKLCYYWFILILICYFLIIILISFQYLRDEYHNGNATIISLLNTTRIHILPTMNPDGFNRSRISQCESSEGRNNGKGHVDLNRSFEGIA